MPYCCAVNCNNGTGSGRSFYLFPREEKRQREWVVRVKREGWQPGKYAALCSDHFDDDSFLKNPHLLESLGVSVGQRRLKPDAVPTKFECKIKQSKEKQTSNAQAKRRRLEEDHGPQKRRKETCTTTGEQLQRERLSSASGKKSDHLVSPDYGPSIFTHTKSSAKRQNTKALQKSEKRQNLKKRKRGSRKQVTAECAVLGLRDTDVTTPFECSTDSTESSPEVADLEDEGSAEALDENETLSFELECRILRKENRTLKEQLKKYSLCQESFSEDNDKVEQFTGLPTYGIMMVAFQFIRPYLNLNRKFSSFQQFLLTCMHLRLNLNLQFLAYLFSISLETASRVFSNTCDVMFCRLVPALVIWPDRKHLRQSLPVSFQQNFEKCCCIIDCFEIFQEKPSDVETPRKTCLQNKSHNSSKYLIGIAPQGAVCFVSQGWDGHCSDKHITEHCGFLDELLPGDLILADRGFDGGDAVGLPSANVNISAFTRGTSQMSALDVEGTRVLASARIHVERIIGMVRQKYTILSNTVPMSLVHSKDNGITSLDKIVHICCALTNLSDRMILFE
ncbi:uncharacterized protein LOC132894263 isoform X2 [Neoarius graeffei]|uniref:uncharacterized protein LOC132894263 isoform X2 n=1 Tax=Neoarius graeffei TaxID=443677 RepID=UPI00298CAE6C|nr:uncharacterized protein LOC132894263 isoform X2 [Neoarius graeffei]